MNRLLVLFLVCVPSLLKADPATDVKSCHYRILELASRCAGFEPSRAVSYSIGSRFTVYRDTRFRALAYRYNLEMVPDKPCTVKKLVLVEQETEYWPLEDELFFKDLNVVCPVK